MTREFGVALPPRRVDVPAAHWWHPAGPGAQEPAPEPDLGLPGPSAAAPRAAPAAAARAPSGWAPHLAGLVARCVEHGVLLMGG
eukprot:1412843-Alexandrium_andersonii.AAC.1